MGHNKDMQPKKDIEEIQRILCESSKRQYIFRGEPQHYSRVSSSLYRSYDKQKNKQNVASLTELDKTTIKEAKEFFPQRATNIEILTVLAHHGIDTNLIDFTYNVLIALFFACSPPYQEDGRIILMHIDDTKKKEDIDYDTHKDETISVNPTGKDPRTIFQSNVFVYAPIGFIKESEYELIIIKKDLKNDILSRLKTSFNISEGSIYNDIQGFISRKQQRKESPTAKQPESVSTQETEGGNLDKTD